MLEPSDCTSGRARDVKRRSIGLAMTERYGRHPGCQAIPPGIGAIPTRSRRSSRHAAIRFLSIAARNHSPMGRAGRSLAMRQGQSVSPLAGAYKRRNLSRSLSPSRPVHRQPGPGSCSTAKNGGGFARVRAVFLARSGRPAHAALAAGEILSLPDAARSFPLRGPRVRPCGGFARQISIRSEEELHQIGRRGHPPNRRQDQAQGREISLRSGFRGSA